MSSQVDSLRAVLSSLPTPPSNSSAATTTASSISHHKLSYVMSRNKYLTKRLEEKLTTYVGTYDEEKEGGFEMPDSEDNGEKADEETLKECLELAGEISKLESGIVFSNGAIEEGRNDLEKCISAMESDPNQSSMSDDAEVPVVQAKAGDINKLEEDITQEGKRKTELLRRIEECKKQITANEKRTASAAAGLASAGGTIDSVVKVKGDLQGTNDMIAWYTAVKTAMEQLAGVEVKKVKQGKDGCNVVIGMKAGQEGEERELVVCCKVRGGKLKVDDAVTKGEVLRDGLGIIKCDLPDLTDLVSFVSTMEGPHDVRTVVREARERLRSAAARVRDVGDLRKRMQVKSQGGELETIKVMVCEGGLVDVRLSKDYPKGRAVTVTGLEARGVTKEDGDKIKAEINAEAWEGVAQAMEKCRERVMEERIKGVGDGLGLGLPR
mmetsp:Transcript_18762/g.39056  ORF Transcript_18762/g.39056 Transcript_18762/m.39056 type:complete len:438 (+) Transcript_18762:156-1469(+)